MKIKNPRNIIGKEVFDVNGKAIGRIDKIWNSWNQKHPGPFFGIRINQNIRDTCFRGTYKLIPIYSKHIKEVGEYVSLNRTIDELCRSWNKTFKYKHITCPDDKLLDKSVYDKNHSRVGFFYSLIDNSKKSRKYGILIDPYLRDIWKAPQNTLMPIPSSFITNITDTINLDKTLDELKIYWTKHFNLSSKSKNRKNEKERLD